MAFEGLFENATFWNNAFERSASLSPSIFADLVVTDVVLPLRTWAGAIVSDDDGRYWLCEAAMAQTIFVSFARPQSIILLPIYGPWEGRRPDMIALNEFEKTMIEALENPIKNRSNAA